MTVQSSTYPKPYIEWAREICWLTTLAEVDGFYRNWKNSLIDEKFTNWIYIKEGSRPLYKFKKAQYLYIDNYPDKDINKPR